MPRRRENPRRVRSDARAASPLPVVNPAISKPKKTKSEVPCGAASGAGGNSAESRVAGTRGDDASPHRLQRGVLATRAAYRGFGYRRARVPAVTSPERTALNLGGFSPPRTQFGAVLVVEPSPFSAASAGLVPVCVPTPITRGCAGVVARRREVQTRSRAALSARVSGCLTRRFERWPKSQPRVQILFRVVPRETSAGLLIWPDSLLAAKLSNF